MVIPEKKPLSVYSGTANSSMADNKNELFDYCEPVRPANHLFLDKYIDRTFDILSTKSSSVLVTGNRGVGKTALINYLQYLIDNCKCPKKFYDTQIIELNILSLEYGIRSISEYEERLITLFAHIIMRKKAGDKIVLFIDNLNELLASSSINTVTHLYLEKAINANIKIIACCGTNDMKSIESKYSLMRHFTEIKVKEPIIDEVKEIVKHKSAEFSTEYRVGIAGDMCDKIVMLCDKYVKNNMCMPAKALNVLELAVAKRCNNAYKPGKNIMDKIEKLGTVQDEIDMMVVDAKNGGNLAALLEKNEELASLKYSIKNNVSFVKSVDTCLTDDDIYSVVSDLAGVPVTKLSESDTSKLKNMVPCLETKVIGQSETIDKVCKTVKRNRLGLRKKNRTIGNFLFIGSTGVGKTFLAKKLAEYMFGTEDSLIRLDMSEYTDEISVNKLIGAPPGYVGYGEGGVLCNSIKNNPYSVILFDEIEKAHPAIYNTILQLMDEGRITDSNGNRISATNNIVILTSNIGVKEAANAAQTVGFSSSQEDFEKKNTSNRKNIIMNSMKKRFSPEFLNRLDSICYFNDLNYDNLSDIFENEISEVCSSVKDLGYKLKISKGTKHFIVEKSEKEKMGARALIRNIQQDIVDEMTEMIINEDSAKKTISVGMDKNKEKIQIKIS